MEKTCFYCGCENQQLPSGDNTLRPYGPGGAYVCFDCAHETLERIEEAVKRFNLSINKLEQEPGFDPDKVEFGAVDGPRLKP